MTKLYTLALGAAVCLSASAIEPDQAIIRTSFDGGRDNMAIEKLTIDTNRDNTPGSRSFSIYDYEGEYTWGYTSLLNSTAGDHTGEVTISVVDESTGEIAIEGILQTTLRGVIQESQGQILIGIINKQKIADTPNGPVYFYVKEAHGSTLEPGAVNDDFTVGQIFGQDITFYKWDIWAIGNYENEDRGWYLLCHNNTFTPLQTPEDNTLWEDYCTGTFVDGWMTPDAGVNPEDFPWSVTIQKRVDDLEDNNGYIYRLANPYGAADSPFIDNVKGDGYIDFDISDESFVSVFPRIYSGVYRNNTKYYFFNIEGFYTSMGYTKEEITSELTDYTWSTYSNLVVDIQNCRYDINRNCESPYVWADALGNSKAPIMKGSITFDKAPDGDGIQTVSTDESNAEAVYYNLQGVRLDKPANGICIRVQGGKATKVMVR